MDVEETNPINFFILAGHELGDTSCGDNYFWGFQTTYMQCRLFPEVQCVGNRCVCAYQYRGTSGECIQCKLDVITCISLRRHVNRQRLRLARSVFSDDSTFSSHK